MMTLRTPMILAVSLALSLMSPARPDDAPAEKPEPTALAREDFALKSNDPSLGPTLKAIETYLEELFFPVYFKREVTVERLTARDFADHRQAEETPETRGDRWNDWLVLKLLNLIGGSAVDAENAYQSKMAVSLVGSYNYRAKKIIMPPARSGDEAVLAHECAHAIFDQWIPFRTRLDSVKGDDDALTAAYCAIEGIAMLAEELLDAWQQDPKRGEKHWVPTTEALAAVRARARAGASRDLRRCRIDGRRGDPGAHYPVPLPVRGPVRFDRGRPASRRAGIVGGVGPRAEDAEVDPRGDPRR